MTNEVDAVSELVQKARRGNRRAFEDAVDPHREELRLYCYRMTASMDDADDLLQETLLRAWRGLGNFSGRSTFRAWLYRIATNRCLDVLGGRAWRDPQTLSIEELQEDPNWLQPLRTDTLTWLDTTDPADRLMREQSLGLAFLVAVQRLPANQRGALLLKEVLGYSAQEAAQILDMSVDAHNSALQRARSTMASMLPSKQDCTSDEEKRVVEQLIEAFESGDTKLLGELFTDKTLLTMPPQPQILRGGSEIIAFLENQTPFSNSAKATRLISLRVNAMPAVAVYFPQDNSETLRFIALMVLSIRKEQIEKITGFTDPEVTELVNLETEISREKPKLH